MAQKQKESNKVPGEDLIGGATKGQIAAWKKKHGVITLVTVEGEEGEDLYFWFRKPSMDTMGPVVKFAETDPLRSNQIFFANCLLNQSNLKYKDDVEVMMAVGPHMQGLVKQRTAKIKNF